MVWRHCWLSCREPPLEEQPQRAGVLETHVHTPTCQAELVFSVLNGTCQQPLPSSVALQASPAEPCPARLRQARPRGRVKYCRATTAVGTVGPRLSSTADSGMTSSPPATAHGLTCDAFLHPSRPRETERAPRLETPASERAPGPAYQATAGPLRETRGRPRRQRPAPPA